MKPWSAVSFGDFDSELGSSFRAYEAAPPSAYMCHQPSIHVLQAYAERMSELRELEKLGDDWDGYGGAAPSASVLGEVRRILNAYLSLDPAYVMPEVVPTANGTIALEWQDGTSEALLEIGSEKSAGYIRPHRELTVWLGGSDHALNEQVPVIVNAYLCSAKNDSDQSISAVDFAPSGA